MARSLALWLPIVVLLAGCQNPGIGSDPFGPTTIPAPQTGAAKFPNSIDPFYSTVSSSAPLVSLSEKRSALNSSASRGKTTNSGNPRNPVADTTAWSSVADKDDRSHRLQPIPPYENNTKSIAVTEDNSSTQAKVALVSNVSAGGSDSGPLRENTGGLRWSGGSPENFRDTSSFKTAPDGSPLPRSSAARP